jgi:hypothetical protein
VIPLPLLVGATVGADRFAGSLAPLSLLAFPPAAGAGDAAGPLWDGRTDVAWDTAPAAGWVTTDVRADEPASVVPG